MFPNAKGGKGELTSSARERICRMEATLFFSPDEMMMIDPLGCFPWSFQVWDLAILTGCCFLDPFPGLESVCWLLNHDPLQIWNAALFLDLPAFFFSTKSLYPLLDRQQSTLGMIILNERNVNKEHPLTSFYCLTLNTSFLVYTITPICKLNISN